MGTDGLSGMSLEGTIQRWWEQSIRTEMNAPGMMTHTYDPALESWEQDYLKLKDSLHYLRSPKVNSKNGVICVSPSNRN